MRPERRETTRAALLLAAALLAAGAADFAKWGRERGMSRREAIIEAGRIRCARS